MACGAASDATRDAANDAASAFFVRSIDRRDAAALEIHQIQTGDVGVVVWDAALVLTHYLEAENHRQQGKWLVGKTVVELGCGTGVVAVEAASRGAFVVATDLTDLTELMEKNKSSNLALIQANDGRLECMALDWARPVPHDLTDTLTRWKTEDNFSSSFPHPDIILLSDCVYYESSVKLLVDTLDALSGSETLVLCAFEERKTDNKLKLEKLFLSLIRQIFYVSFVPMDEMDETFRSPDIHILRLKKKAVV